MTYSTCTECKDPGFGFHVSTLASIRNMRDFKTKNILTEQIRINPLTPEGLWHTNLDMFHTRAEK